MTSIVREQLTVLVTGAAGYVGSITSEQLLVNGFEVIAIDNFQTGHRAAVLPDVVLVEGDFGSRELLERVFRAHKVDVVLHFAAETTIETSMADPGPYFQNNLVRGISLLDAMLKHGCRSLVFSSTAALFGEPVRTPIDEDHPAQPINPYGQSKLMFEQVLDWYHRCYDLRFTALRYFNAAGASQLLGEDHRPESHLLPLLCDAALGRRDSVKIFGRDYATPDGTCLRDYIHVLDLADAHILALRHLDVHPNGKFNLGAGRAVSNLELLRTVEQVSGATIEFEFGPRRAGDPAVLVASPRRAVERLGWSPRHSALDTIVESALHWRGRHSDGYGSGSGSVVERAGAE